MRRGAIDIDISSWKSNLQAYGIRMAETWVLLRQACNRLVLSPYISSMYLVSQVALGSRSRFRVHFVLSLPPITESTYPTLERVSAKVGDHDEAAVVAHVDVVRVAHLNVCVLLQS